MHSESVGLHAEGVSYSYDVIDVIRDVSFGLDQNDMLALAGPNGSGKTSLVKLLSGLRKPTRGRVYLGTRRLDQYPGRERARLIAVVPQSINPTSGFTVGHLVAMGRAAHSRLFGTLGINDRDAIEQAMDATDSKHLAPRLFAELSGGERQRVVLAMALAQEAHYLLLDEPTVHMDLQHQRELLETLRRLRRERGLGILAVMHDLNLAALYFDRLILLHEGQIVSDGTPSSVIDGPEFERVFRAPFNLVPHPQSGVPQVLLRRDSW